MVTIKELCDRPCFICGKATDNVEVRMKDGTFSGVICKDDLWKVLTRGKSVKKQTGGDS